ncbi:hypothetical protein R3P38DRAFT_3262534 [Favolaschia claudopus]|uniref:Uncharacterized protein n=1 Tax=Favolaschia claudopus TaxID=2862362 RepID=A0AAW0CI33_9AGAR
MADKPLKLDPGPHPRRPRGISLCKCLCWTITIPILCFATWLVGSFVLNLVQEARFPHKSLYHVQSSQSTYDAGEVIQPLIRDEDTFDIAVSVWLRAPEAEEAAARSHIPPVSTTVDAPASTQVELDGFGKFWVGLKMAEDNDRFRDEFVLEKPLFSDVVFRGLRLSDKHASAKVDFRMPVARFMASKLTESDLRATFMILPSSPSLINHVKNFSSWMPDSVFAKRRPIRPWPFPLGSDSPSDKTISDLALESFAISVPLVEFHDAAFPLECVNESNDTEVTADSEHAVHNHPYIVTRTQLRIIRETGLFDASAYNAVRDEIKIHSCGQGIPGIQPNLKMCRRTYKSNGIFETLFELEVPTDSGVQTQWAYAPYLDTKEHASGPVDTIPVPVNRANCSSSSVPSQNDSELEYMDISWRIAFSSRTPGKQVLADNLVSPQTVDHRASELQRLTQQNDAELWNGALGHRFHDDAHPRRRVLISIISFIALSIEAILAIHYWWNTVSTVGLSTFSVVCLASSFVLDPIVAALQSAGEDSWMVVPSLFTPFLMLRCISRIEFGWGGWYPVVRRHPANHRERASQRRDNQTTWRTKLGLFAVILLVYQLTHPFKMYLIPTTVPAPTPEEFSPSRTLDFLCNVYQALYVAGMLSQALLNHRMRMYAGGYRAGIVLFVVGNLVDMMYFVPGVVGRMEMRQGLTPLTIVNRVIELPLVWQAVTLRPVDGRDDGED